MINRILICRTLIVFLAISRVAGECTCEKGDLESDPKSVTLPYKLGSIFAILFASAVGVAVPLAGNKFPALSPDGNIFFLVKAFAAGVILATGFIHILPDAFENLSSPCITNPVWEEFPFTGFIAMLAAIATLMVESTAAGYYRRRHFKGQEKSADEEHAGHVHAHTHGHAPQDAHDGSTGLDLIRHRVTTQVLEMGIVVHSIIIGISLGTSQSLATIKPL